MSNYTDFLGIDISKSIFDIVNTNNKHKQYTNDAAEFKKFIKTIPENNLCVMEVTGIYHWLKLTTATFKVLPLVKRDLKSGIRILKNSLLEEKH